MTAADLEFAEGETLVVGDELLYRQITKHLLDDEGRVATHAFTGPSAEEKPSYGRSSIVTAQDARDWHTEHAKSPSLSVHAVTVSEVIAAGRWVIDDSKSPLELGKTRAPGHCFVDVRKLDRQALKDLRAELWQAAMRRGEIPTREPLPDGEFDLEALQA
jgi:hypothetical protein